MKPLYLFFILFTLLWFKENHAQSLNSFNYYTITEKDGLPDNDVRCLAVDNRGWLWAGTTEGVCCINGSSIKIWKGKEDNLGQERILDIYIKPDNTIFVCNAVGVYMLLPNENSWKTVIQHNISFTCFLGDGNDLWAGSEKGIFKINTTTFSFVQYQVNCFSDSANKVTYNRVNSMAKGHGNTLLIGASNKVFEFNKTSNTYIPVINFNTKKDDLVSGIALLDNSHWLVYCWNSDVRILAFNAGKYELNSTPLFKVQSNQKIYTYSVNDGLVIIQIGLEHSMYDSVNHSFKFAPSQKFDKKIGSSTAVYIPQQKKIVLASIDNGLMVVDIQPKSFHHIRFADSSNATTQSIVLKEWNDKLLVGTTKKQFLQAFNLKQLNDDSVAKPFIKLIVPNACLAIEPQNNNTCIVASEDGLRIVNKQLQTIKQVTESIKVGRLPKNFVVDIFIDSKKRHWIFPWRKGIWQTDSLLDNFTLQKEGFIADNVGGTKNLLIANAVEDKLGNIWFADLDEGLIYWDAATNQYSKPFVKEFGEKWRLNKVIYHHPFIWFIKEHEYLVRYNIETQKTEKFSIPEFYRKNIFDVASDGKRLWMALSNGLVNFDYTTHEFQRFTEQDGLLHNRIDGSLVYLSNGQMLLGQENFLTIFNPDSIASKTTIPNVQLELFKANDSVYTNIFIKKSKLVLPYNKNNITLQWALADFGLPFANNYYYRIVSKDSNWIYVGNKGILNLTSLSPGTYAIELWAANARGTYAKKTLLVQFIIKPPFWFTWWFILLTSLLVISIVTYFVRKRIVNIKAKALIQQQLSELEMKVLKAQMNPHFIFNSLTSIQDSIVHGNTDAPSNYLGKFSKLIRMVLQQSDEKLITIQEEIDYITLYLELESFRFDDFSYTINCSQIHDINFYKIPAMIVQPYVENAIKHGLSHKQGNKLLQLVYVEHNNFFQITLTDNGIGRTASTKINANRIASHESMGMKITSQRLQLLDEKFANVEIEDLNDEVGNASGTKVLITIPIEK